MRITNGRHSLEAIFAQLKYAPTAMVWHATARLASHRLINYARQVVKKDTHFRPWLSKWGGCIMSLRSKD
ncbi:MAG: hypothetical protein HY986_20015 [Candidatus Melainabacteria bacterium]|nr:hypothetical protein [Candidatus Melainabacteria bacterium]